MIAILMGVTASGKTTIAEELAALTGWKYAEGDAYHSLENRRKMHAGIPLTDADRAPWLESLHAVIVDWFEKGESGVMTCSALKQAYRDTLVKDVPHDAYRFVLLEASMETLQARLEQRTDHFMNPDLLASQIDTLELPSDALRVDSTDVPTAVAEHILSQLRQPPAQAL
jgi:gluconokinase